MAANRGYDVTNRNQQLTVWHLHTPSLGEPSSLPWKTHKICTMANKSTIIALIWCCSWSRNNLVKKYPLTPHHQPLSCQISTKLRAEISITGGLYLVLAAIVVLRRDNSGKMMIRRFSVEEKHQVRTHSYLLDLLINEIRNLKFDLIAVRNILPHPWDSNYLDQRQNEWFQFGNHDFLFCRLSLESACGGRGLFRWFCDGRHGKWDIQFLLNRRFIVIPLKYAQKHCQFASAW